MLAESYILTSPGVCWHVLASFVVWRYLDGVWGVVWGYMSDVCGYLRCLHVSGGYLGVHPLPGGEFTLFWHSHERQDFFHLSILRHQNIKMSIYILYKNGWVLPFFSFLMSVKEK